MVASGGLGYWNVKRDSKANSGLSEGSCLRMKLLNNLPEMSEFLGLWAIWSQCTKFEFVQKQLRR
jgi:hypothetical protein